MIVNTCEYARLCRLDMHAGVSWVTFGKMAPVPVTLLPSGSQYHNVPVPDNYRLGTILKEELPAAIREMPTTEIIPNALSYARKFLSGLHMEEFQESFTRQKLGEFSDIVCFPTSALVEPPSFAGMLLLLAK